MVGGSITALEQEDRNLPGWPRYWADKWSFSSDLGGTTEYNFRPLGTEVFFIAFMLLFAKRLKWQSQAESNKNGSHCPQAVNVCF